MFFTANGKKEDSEPNSGKYFQNLTHIITEDHTSFHRTYSI